MSIQKRSAQPLRNQQEAWAPWHEWTLNLVATHAQDCLITQAEFAAFRLRHGSNPTHLPQVPDILAEYARVAAANGRPVNDTSKTITDGHDESAVPANTDNKPR